MKHSVENAAIYDVLPLKSARRDVIDNLKFWGIGTGDLILIISFTFLCGVTLFRLHRNHGKRLREVDKNS